MYSLFDMKRVWEIAIPSSFTANLSSLVQRTMITGFLARALAIFGIDTIYIYRDPIIKDMNAEKQFIKILKYMVVPQYLKKDLFPIDRDLSHVGLLPPLRIQLHKEWEAIKNLNLPDVRIGLVIDYKMGRSIIDVGLDKYVAVKGRLGKGNLVIVRLDKVCGKYIKGEVLNKDELKECDVYPGYRVIRLKIKLTDFLKRYDGLIISTSRLGVPIEEIIDEFISELRKSNRVLILFGSFKYGLNEIFKYYNDDVLNYAKFNINLVKNQKVETIRVEEAVYIALSIFKFIERYVELENK